MFVFDRGKQVTITPPVHFVATCQSYPATSQTNRKNPPPHPVSYRDTSEINLPKSQMNVETTNIASEANKPQAEPRSDTPYKAFTKAFTGNCLKKA